MADKRFTFSSYLYRLLIALVLVFASYNPSDYSWFYWFVHAEEKIDPLILLSGVILLIGWVIFLRATIRSLGIIGTLLATAFFATLVWVMIDYNIISLDNPTILQYAILVILAAIMAIGISWSHIRRRMSGQLDVDDVEPD